MRLKKRRKDAVRWNFLDLLWLIYLLKMTTAMLDEVRFCSAHIARTEKLVSCVMHFIVISKLSQAVFKARILNTPKAPILKMRKTLR
jgi:hypothetical protein